MAEARLIELAPHVPGIDGRDIAALHAPQGPRRQRIDGFDADYADIVDYIVRCTHRIWEQKDVGLIETHYSADCRVHLMTGPQVGVDGIVAGTVATLAAFPDRTLVAEAVIWADLGAQTFLTSHRISGGGTNLGPSEFGPATGRRVGYTTIADCICTGNRIVEEWLVRDNSALVLGLGLHPGTVARAQAAADRADGSTAPAPWRQAAMARILDAARTPFPAAALPDATRDPHGFAHALFDAVWNHRRFARIRDAYDPAATLAAPGGRELFGHGEITGWAAALCASFGDARFAVDHVAVNEAPGGHDIAVRWTMAGTHDGDALYGAASGRPIYILAVTHWRIAGGRIVDEVVVFDEIALLRQIEGGL
ncbi:ester cyclase [Glacieibacterium frigidum]|uniref:Ester cyclase n=1 Tax=Glacieibacterium frigidum TaxID=2593303 RepID=A0A552UHQ5_9SPHN|nr:ester cyclase [Glacieibacterium frigidum]TRW17753.1 ester cyclase [Glacieibacterium frigidum]